MTQEKVVDDCAILKYQDPSSVELPECPRHGLLTVVEAHSHLFHTTPGVSQACHFIPILFGSPQQRVPEVRSVWLWELNKKTVKDSYPLPLPDEVQDQLAGSAVFSTLDLQSGYWQMPVNPADQLFALDQAWGCMSLPECLSV